MTQLPDSPKPEAMLRVVRVLAPLAALAMAASRIGALVLGFYAGIAVGMAPSLSTPSGLQIFWAASTAALGAFALVAAALWLEHLCRLPAGPDDGARP